MAEAGMICAFVVSRLSKQCLTTGMMPDANSPAPHHMQPKTPNFLLRTGVDTAAFTDLTDGAWHEAFRSDST